MPFYFVQLDIISQNVLAQYKQVNDENNPKQKASSTKLEAPVFKNMFIFSSIFEQLAHEKYKTQTVPKMFIFKHPS